MHDIIPDPTHFLKPLEKDISVEIDGDGLEPARGVVVMQDRDARQLRATDRSATLPEVE